MQTIPEDGFVIAHNMKREDAVFYTNLNEGGRTVWDNTPKCDTMKKSLLSLLPGKHATKYREKKSSSLIELHKIVQPEGRRLESSHRSALADVRMAWDIFSYYKGHTNKHQLLRWYG